MVQQKKIKVYKRKTGWGIFFLAIAALFLLLFIWTERSVSAQLGYILPTPLAITLALLVFYALILCVVGLMFLTELKPYWMIISEEVNKKQVIRYEEIKENG